MPIEFRCSSCNKLLRVPDGSEGKKAQCPDCQAILEIPVVATEAPTSSPFGAAPGPTGFDPPPASDNPFESPRASAYAGDLTSDQAMSRVSAPATCLIVVSAIGIALYIISTIFILVMGGAFFGMDLPGNNQVPAFQFMQSAVWHVIQTGVGIARCALIIYGALQMKKLRNYGLSLTVSIIAIVPCFSACCLLDIPFGIWSVVVLSQSEVRQAFDRIAPDLFQ